MLLLVVDDAHFKKESTESLAMPHIHVFFLKGRVLHPGCCVCTVFLYIFS